MPRLRAQDWGGVVRLQIDTYPILTFSQKCPKIKLSYTWFAQKSHRFRAESSSTGTYRGVRVPKWVQICSFCKASIGQAAGAPTFFMIFAR